MEEKIAEASTPEEMRKAIFDLSHHDHLTASVVTHADYHGLSGEDRYTMLAYMAIKEYQRLMDYNIRAAMLNFSPKSVFIKDDE